MKKVIIFGISDFADQIFRYNKRDRNFEIAAFTVDREYLKVSEFCGIPVIPFDEIPEKYSPEDIEFIIAVGYQRMNDIRKNTFEKIKKLGFSLASFVHPTAVILTDNIGEGNIILEGTVIGLDCKIGNCNIFKASTHISHDTVIGDYNYFSVSTSVAGEVEIKNNCFFGNNSTTNDKISIASYTLAGAGAYISHDVTDEYGVYVPARTVRLEHKTSRDMKL